MSHIELSEQEIIRRNSLQELRNLGIEPYPAEQFKVNTNSNFILSNFKEEKVITSASKYHKPSCRYALNKQKESRVMAQIAGKKKCLICFKNDDYPIVYQQICIAGRIMNQRIMGSASFAELMDDKGRIQIYVKRDDICPGDDKTMYNTVFKKLLDIGDFIGVRGYVFITQMGEITIHVKEFTVLSKSLKPLPIVKEKDGQVFDAVTDPEFKYRQRYVDLVVNPGIKEVFVKRTKIFNSMREFFNSKGYLEVETPILQPIPGGAAARPFKTHHNALDVPLYLRIANELYLKRLIVGGFEGVYEFSKDFRNEGMDRTHNPEFTVMEIYVAYKDYHWMMSMTEEMLEKIAIDINGSTKVQMGDKSIDFKKPFKRITMIDAIKEYTSVDISGMDEDQLRKVCKEQNVEIDQTMGKGKLIDALFGEKCEPALIQPTFIMDYPVEMSPLCKKHRNNPELTERFELIVNGKELCNAYSELNDPIDQRDRFQEQLKLSEKGDNEAMFIDQDFLRALEYGMPPTSGMGIGMDRLTMLMTNQSSIQDVLFFPQMRPEKFESNANDSIEKYTALGIPAEWVEVLQKIGYKTTEKLQQVEKFTKLHQEICGYNKKNQLGLKNPMPEEVKAWIEKK